MEKKKYKSTSTSSVLVFSRSERTQLDLYSLDIDKPTSVRVSPPPLCTFVEVSGVSVFGDRIHCESPFAALVSVERGALRPANGLAV